MCVHVCCESPHVFWLCGCLYSDCVHACACTCTQGKGFTQPQGMNTHLHRRTCPQLFLFYSGEGEWRGREGRECILIFSANWRRDLILSGFAGFLTKCPTSLAVIPDSSIANCLQSPLPSFCPGRKGPCVASPTAAVSCGSTALGFCSLLISLHT